MSIQLMAMVWEMEFPNASRKLVALALADLANAEGICWPSVRSLKTMCSLGDSQVRDHLAALELEGFLRRFPRKGDGGRQTSNVFEILVRRSPPSGGPDTPLRPTGTPPTGVPAPPPSGLPAPLNHQYEPLFEPPKNQKAGGGLDLGLDDGPDFPAASMTRSWNTRVPSLPKVTAIKGERARHARARWKELGGTMADWDAFCDRIEKADKLTGRFKRQGDTREWKASLDWCLEPHKFARIREGFYDNPQTPNPNPYERKLW